ncbi:MAG: hypothetical protein KatS3mg026_1674 [Bacteroidia bacterium]|nr:MAG: hypothetical protein KatS3mg026_1674 [Bacteroidia bacterium]
MVMFQVLLAQYVWDWHGEALAGKGELVPSGSGAVGSRLYSRMQVVGDTLWVMGNACLREGDTLYLPEGGGMQAIVRNPNTAGQGYLGVGFLAAYDRLSGQLLEVWYAHADPTQSFTLEFRDFAVGGGYLLACCRFALRRLPIPTWFWYSHDRPGCYLRTVSVDASRGAGWGCSRRLGK